MYYNKVDISGVDTSKLIVLKEHEKMELLKRYRNGDKSARDKLISGNLRLVLSVIQKFIGKGENADDLFQIGCIGLIKAIDNFNTDLDVRFSTYAVPMINSCRESKNYTEYLLYNLKLQSYQYIVSAHVVSPEESCQPSHFSF